RLLREHRIDDLEARLLLVHVVERQVAVLVLLVDQDRMALREGAAFAVLSREPHRFAVEQQRAEGQALGGRPVDALAAPRRLAAGDAGAPKWAGGGGEPWDPRGTYPRLPLRRPRHARDAAAPRVLGALR